MKICTEFYKIPFQKHISFIYLKRYHFKCLIDTIGTFLADIAIVVFCKGKKITGKFVRGNLFNKLSVHMSMPKYRHIDICRFMLLNPT